MENYGQNDKVDCLQVNCQSYFAYLLLVEGQTLGSVTTFLGRNHMNLFRKFDVFEFIFARRSAVKAWQKSFWAKD